MGLLTRWITRRGLLPAISDTERAALEAGTVWADGELFRGAPDFARLLAEPWPELAPREREFLAGPVRQACALVDPWALDHARELPPPVWAFLREHRFFGLGIPEDWEGTASPPTPRAPSSPLWRRTHWRSRPWC